MADMAVVFQKGGVFFGQINVERICDAEDVGYKEPNLEIRYQFLDC
jgi:hypothetical protein